MGSNIGPKIGVDGSKEFKSQLAQITQSMKVLKSEAKLVSSEFIGQSNSAEALSKKNDVLKRTVYTLNEQLELQKKELQMAAREYGEANEYTMRMQEAVNKTQTALNKANAEIRRNAEAMNNLGRETEETEKKTSTFSETFKGVFSAEALKQGLKIAFDVIKEAGQAAYDAAKEAAEFADSINTLSAQTGLSTKQLQEFEYMADLVDVDVEALTGSMAKLVKNMDTARKGTGSAAEAFDNLKISVVDSNGELRNNKDVFFEVIEKLSEMTNETERDAAAMAIFGKSAQDLNPLILAGADAMKKFADEAGAFGRVYSEEELAKLNAFNDDTYRLKSLIEGFKTDIIVENIDKFSGAVNEATDYVADLRENLAENGLISTLVKLDGAIIKHMPMWSVLKGGVALVKAEIEAASNAFDRLKAKLAGGTPGVDAVTGAAPSTGGKKTGPNITINTKSMSKSDTDYVINKANSTWGGNL